MLHVKLQVHQIEVQQTRKRKNLRLFEQLSSQNKLLTEQKKKSTSNPIGVPLVQEFIRESNGEEISTKENADACISLLQTKNEQESSTQGQSNDHSPVSDHQSSIIDPIFSQPLLVKTECQKVTSIQVPLSSSTSSYPAFYSTSESRLPKAFKAKLKKNLINSALKTPKINPVRITNLSYSQPSTPKTPLFRSFICATPRIQKSNNARYLI